MNTKLNSTNYSSIFISYDSVMLFRRQVTSEPDLKILRGKLVVKSDPSGARIYSDRELIQVKDTPDSLANLEPGTYNGFVYLQYL
jgi:hypothetical protein